MDRIQSSTVIQHPKVGFGLSWLVVIPAGLWALLNYYLPVIGGTLSPLQARLAAPVVILVLALSFYLHVAAHYAVARRLRASTPVGVRISVFGDSAQAWPSVAGWPEVIVAAAGPVMNLILAGAAYLLWNAQINDFVGDLSLVAAGFNGWMLLINLMPAFPMDGGRIARAGLRGMGASQDSANRLLQSLGFMIAAGLTVWAIILFAQNARFSLETAAITFLFVLVLLDGLWTRAAGGVDGTTPRQRRVSLSPLRILSGAFAALVLAVPSGSLLLVNNGLEAPGVALSTASMINVPPAYHHAHAGSFYLLTVISQAPITAGAWLLGQVDPAVQIVPPEYVTPKNTTPQQQAQQGYQMLDESEATAIAVGLRLAGYPAAAIGKGARVDDILPESHANGVLQVGDVITALNGSAIHTASELTALVKAQPQNSSARLQLVRGQGTSEVSVPFMDPAAAGSPPRIGIGVEDAGLDFHPPFPVSIVTQKISGGPSAGLMFTLTLYNALTASDLTGGRKIAGTGTINLDGTVGPIGGVKQKVFAAEGVGASYFLCPVENYADAVSVATNIKVIQIATADQAVAFLRSLPAAP